MERFFETCCTRSWHLAHDRGVPMAENAAPLIKAFPHWEAHIRAWHDQWNAMFDGPVPGATALLAELSAHGVPLYALTNMPAEVMPALHTLFPFLSVFRDLVVSGEEGILKPDRRIFEIALQRIGRPAQEVIFIDDTKANVHAAQALGMKALHFRSMARLREELIRHGVTLSP